MTQSLTESQAVTKIRSAFGVWPPMRGKALGKIDTWLIMLWKNQVFRDTCQAKNDGSLAHYVCEQVEAISVLKGDPWSRNPPAIKACLLYTSPSPRDQRGSRMPSSA